MANRYVVRYGVTRTVGEFVTKGQLNLGRNSPVIIRSERGVEWGEALCPASEQTREYLGSQQENGTILREATMDDHTARSNLYRKMRGLGIQTRKDDEPA